MADINDYTPVDMSTGYGDPSAAGYFGLKKELAFRAAQQRQAQLDEAQRQKDALAAEVSRSTMSLNEVEKTSKAQLNEEKAQQMKAAEFAKNNGIGADLSQPGMKDLAVRLFGPNAVKTTPAQEASAGVSAEAPASIAALPEDLPAGAPLQDIHAAAPEKTTFAGTEEQKQKKSMTDIAHGILNNEYDSGDPDENEALKGWALSTLMTGKAVNFPGNMHPKSKAEKDSTRAYNAMVANDMNKKDPSNPAASAEDTSFAQHWLEHNATQAQKDAFRVNFQMTGQEFQRSERGSRELFTVKNKFRNDLATQAKDLSKDLERVDRAESLLKRPNWVADAVAAPEFLQIVAGGMGTGLRMTDAELNRINGAQSKLDQLRGQLAKWVTLGAEKKVVIEKEMRDNMMNIIQDVRVARERYSQQNEDALFNVENAESKQDVDEMRSNLLKERRETKLGEKPAEHKGSSKEETADERRARIRKLAGL